jgi:LysR family transcriptional regulator, glycine cleavage system transcriptional activator
MPARFGRLPLRGMTVFEAAARHGKFAAAAQELAMTQAGVSQHIAQLEGELGVALFHRRHRGVQLTDAGETLLLSVEHGMRVLSDGWASIRRSSVPGRVNILTDFGFAAWWLMPRLAQLSDLMPQVEIRLVTTQSSLQPAGDDFDLAILFGDGDWPGYRADLLFGEQVYPVCVPGHVEGRALPLAPADLAGMRLLHLRGSGPKRWFGWDDWFAAMGVAVGERQQELAFNNYQIVLQAVLLGQGVALGWAPLIDDMVANGTLVRLMEMPLTSHRGYHLIERHDHPLDGHAAVVARWLRDMAVMPDGHRRA